MVTAQLEKIICHLYQYGYGYDGDAYGYGYYGDHYGYDYGGDHYGYGYGDNDYGYDDDDVYFHFHVFYHFDYIELSYY